MKLLSFLLLSLTFLMSSFGVEKAFADTARVCGWSYGTKFYAELDFKNQLATFAKANHLITVTKQPTTCWNDEGVDLCEACSDILYKPFVPEVPLDGITIDPRRITSIDTFQSDEKRVATYCQGYVASPSGLSSDPQYYRPGPCPDELNSTGKVRRNLSVIFSEETTYAHDVGITLNLDDGTKLILGPVSETRQQSSFNENEDKYYKNSHFKTKIALDKLVQKAKLNFVTEEKQCFRVQLVLPKSGSPTSLTYFESKINFDCASVPETTLIIQPKTW